MPFRGHGIWHFPGLGRRRGAVPAGGKEEVAGAALHLRVVVAGRRPAIFLQHRRTWRPILTAVEYQHVVTGAIAVCCAHFFGMSCRPHEVFPLLTWSPVCWRCFGRPTPWCGAPTGSSHTYRPVGLPWLRVLRSGRPSPCWLVGAGSRLRLCLGCSSTLRLGGACCGLSCYMDVVCFFYHLGWCSGLLLPALFVDANAVVCIPFSLLEGGVRVARRCTSGPSGRPEAAAAGTRALP
mmetsp:Transcript_1692/g.5086  ORF Transcript_1692/g.5086 Transcript_1692/m.5086 type:complete len:236 (+) Transcript_1692:96-803(+)